MVSRHGLLFRTKGCWLRGRKYIHFSFQCFLWILCDGFFSSSSGFFNMCMAWQAPIGGSRGLQVLLPSTNWLWPGHRMNELAPIGGRRKTPYPVQIWANSNILWNSICMSQTNEECIVHVFVWEHKELNVPELLLYLFLCLFSLSMEGRDGISGLNLNLKLR